MCESIFFVPPFNYGIELPHYNTTRHNRTGQDKDGSLKNETNHMQKSKKFN